MSEPKAGAHPKNLTTTAAKISGGWKLDGEKAYVTNGPIASHVAVLAITSIANLRKEFSVFLVPVNTTGFIAIRHPQFDHLRPAQHCGFSLESCEVPESALIGRPGQGYQDIARPFRSLEDAVGIGSLMSVLARAGMHTARLLGPELTDEAPLALGELAGIDTAMQALHPPVLAALQSWNTETNAVAVHLIAIHDLARRFIAILKAVGFKRDEHVDRILRDAEKYLDIARVARQIKKARLGQSYFVTAKGFSGKQQA
jgi:acyl-CoA dehydrogenase